MTETTRRPVAVPETLIARARRGDQAAFDAVYRAYQPYLLRHLRLTCGGKAEDVAAGTWESVARGIERFRGDGDGFRRWLFTIARRRLVDDLRRDARRPLAVAPVEDHPHAVFEVESGIEGTEWIAEQLRRLPARQAEVISLRVVAGLGVAEVASLLGISEANVRVLCHRGLASLRDALDVVEHQEREIGVAL